MNNSVSDLGFGIWKWDAAIDKWQAIEDRMYFGGKPPGFDPNNYPVNVRGKFDGQWFRFPLMLGSNPLLCGYCVCGYDEVDGTWYPVPGQSYCTDGCECDCSDTLSLGTDKLIERTKVIACSPAL